MSVISERLNEIGYKPLIDADHVVADTLVRLPEQFGYPVPDDYMEFLAKFPVTGVFGANVVCEGIAPSSWAPHGQYAVSLLYAACSNPSYDLIRGNSDRYDAWDFSASVIAIGDDFGGNVLCLDLGNEMFGRIYFWDHEHMEGESGLHIIADDFTSFISRLRQK